MAYLIVDGTLYAIYEEMLTLVELHRIQKKCSVKNNKMQRQYEFFAWSKLIILKYKIIILNQGHEHRQDFNVYIKQ